MGTGSARCGRGLIRTFSAIANAYVSRRKIDNRSRNKKRRDLARAAGHQRFMLAFNDVKPAHAGSDVDSHAGSILRRDLQARHLHGFIGGSQGEVDEAAHLLHLFFLDEVQRVEVFYFSSDLAGKSSRIKGRNLRYAALALDNI